MKNSPYSVRNATTRKNSYRRPTEAFEDEASLLLFHSSGVPCLFPRMHSYSAMWKSYVAIWVHTYHIWWQKFTFFLFHTQINLVPKSFVPREFTMLWVRVFPRFIPYNPPFVLVTLSIDPLKYGYIIDML